MHCVGLSVVSWLSTVHGVNSIVHCVALSVVSWLSTVHGVNDIKFIG